MAALGAAGLATLSVALYGVQDAFTVALGEDEEKFQEAIKGLSGAAQSAARELRALRPVLLGLRNLVQDALFQPLLGQLTALVDVLLGPVAIGMSSVADALGRAAARVAEFARSDTAVSAITVTFASLRSAGCRTPSRCCASSARSPPTCGRSSPACSTRCAPQEGTRSGCSARSSTGSTPG
ncbi:hypothetical protein [Nonomuraea sp. NPDC049784]|uniref:hypothetical protein n=1 Tax=Nonomuraea sp. NPDC049784 TaxID=3154361 RepID=UPI0033F9947A